MSINKAVISGNLTRDAQLGRTRGGSEMLAFSVAVNDRRKNPATGEWEDAPSFIDCAVFGARAAALAPWLVKGTKVAVEGRLRQVRWESAGEPRSKVSVAVDEVEFMSRRRVAEAEGPRAAQPAAQPAPALYGEDVPF